MEDNPGPHIEAGKPPGTEHAFVFSKKKPDDTNAFAARILMGKDKIEKYRSRAANFSQVDIAFLWHERYEHAAGRTFWVHSISMETR